MMNASGDRGSPCLRPLACFIFLVGLPLIRIFDDEDPRIEDVQLRHFVLNPRAPKTSSKYFHPMESDAFEMSSLMNRAGYFFFLV